MYSYILSSNTYMLYVILQYYYYDSICIYIYMINTCINALY